MENVCFTTKMYNDCVSINKLLYSTTGGTKETLSLFRYVFGIDQLQKMSKFGICATYSITYDFISTDICSFSITKADIYLGRFKLQVKEKNGIQYLDNILNYPVVKVTNNEGLQDISNYLFYNTQLPMFLVEETIRDSSYTGGNYAVR